MTHRQRDGNSNALQTLAEDSRRVTALNERIRRGSSLNLNKSRITLPALRGDTIGSVDYVVTVSFGTPAVQQTVVFDTGSGVCWIQCQPCLGFCYNQTQPIFNPSKSSSYHNLSCTSKACSTLSAKSCSGGTCLYYVRYGDNSETVGFLATEKLKLAPTVVLKNFAFGCGERNEGLFSGFSGLLGLARSPISLLSQASRKLGEVFSYCLPGPRSPAGHLTIGDSNKKVLAAAAFTEMLSNPQEPSLYFLNLIGISVGGHPLKIATTVFKYGTIIDSGTVVTRLPPLAYSALRKTFRRTMLKYSMVGSVDLLDTCYDLKNVKNVSCPTVTLHYDGADVALEPSAVLLSVEESRFCLAFAANENDDDVGIIGNVQQRGMEIIYEVGAKRIGFAPGDCA